MHSLPVRPRRNRSSESIRQLVRETQLRPSDFILPVFLIEGQQKQEAISSMPGCYRRSADLILKEATEAFSVGVRALALFPKIADEKKDSTARESLNAQGLLQSTIRLLKEKLPEMLVITDVAMDPYSSDGHDGLVRDGEIVNDETLDILSAMAVAQAQAGADMVAPSDMMDGRVGCLRRALDAEGFTKVGILAYSAKYCSSFYGPFRDALDSAPRGGDKKTYQMDPANAKEALREVRLDIEEGADLVMVKPALAYLDVIRLVKEQSEVPVAAYNVSGEYAMIKAAAERGWLNEQAAMMEVLTAIKRAGADIILSYFAKDAARLLSA